MVVPALGAAYLWAGKPALLVRVRQLAVACAVMVAVSAAWPLAVTLWPGSKPYIGGSTDGTRLGPDPRLQRLRPDLRRGRRAWAVAAARPSAAPRACGACSTRRSAARSRGCCRWRRVALVVRPVDDPPRRRGPTAPRRPRALRRLGARPRRGLLDPAGHLPPVLRERAGARRWPRWSGIGLVALGARRGSWAGVALLAATIAGTAWLAVELLGRTAGLRAVAARRDPGRGGGRGRRHCRAARGAPRAALVALAVERRVRAVRRPGVLRGRQPRPRASTATTCWPGRRRVAAAVRRRPGGGGGSAAAPPSGGRRPGGGTPPAGFGPAGGPPRAAAAASAAAPRSPPTCSPTCEKQPGLARSTSSPRAARRRRRRSSSRPARRSSRSAASAAATTRRPSPSSSRWSPRASSSTCSPRPGNGGSQRRVDAWVQAARHRVDGYDGPLRRSDRRCSFPLHARPPRARRTRHGRLESLLRGGARAARLRRRDGARRSGRLRTARAPDLLARRREPSSGSTSRSRPPTASASTPSTPPRSPPAGATTAARACGPSTTRTTTARSSSTRTATTPKPSATRRNDSPRGFDTPRRRRRPAPARPVPRARLPGALRRPDAAHAAGASGRSRSPARSTRSAAGPGRSSRRCRKETPTVDIHCVTTWSKFDTDWAGVSVDTLLDGVEPLGGYVTAFCDGGYTTNLPVEDITGGKAWVVYGFDGDDLEPEHGGPARLLVPHLYFWKSAKWVRGLHLHGGRRARASGRRSATTTAGIPGLSSVIRATDWRVATVARDRAGDAARRDADARRPGLERPPRRPARRRPADRRGRLPRAAPLLDRVRARGRRAEDHRRGGRRRRGLAVDGRGRARGRPVRGPRAVRRLVRVGRERRRRRCS